MAGSTQISYAKNNCGDSGFVHKLFKRLYNHFKNNKLNYQKTEPGLCPSDEWNPIYLDKRIPFPNERNPILTRGINPEFTIGSFMQQRCFSQAVTTN
ncbi:MAG: hypothetical protein J6C81_05580 [Muribaculaceae bacterium]|nr:hypothetical protein [Muribaculaceae bacterium]